MVMNIDDLKKCLSVPRIEYGDDIGTITQRDVSVAFQKLALLLHPDKAGKESTAAFQELRDAYEKTRDYFKEMNNFGEDVSIVEIDENQKFFDVNSFLKIFVFLINFLIVSFTGTVEMIK